MTHKNVIDFKKYFDRITKEDRQTMWAISKIMSLTMFDRQQEFATKLNLSQNNNFQRKNRALKIYLGLISERMFYDFLMDDECGFQNSSIKIGKLLELTLSKNFNFQATLNKINSGNLHFTSEEKELFFKPDEFDFEVNGRKIDIKSSKNNKEPYLENEFENKCLKYLNFTLPLDQVKKSEGNVFKHSSIIVQIIYNLKEANGKMEVKNVSCFGGVKIEDLIQEKNLRNLKLNNNNYQQTYMLSLNQGKSLTELLLDEFEFN